VVHGRADTIRKDDADGLRKGSCEKRLVEGIVFGVLLGDNNGAEVNRIEEPSTKVEGFSGKRNYDPRLREDDMVGLCHRYVSQKKEEL
jgi:hypothetical protein